MNDSCAIVSWFLLRSSGIAAVTIEQFIHLCRPDFVSEKAGSPLNAVTRRLAVEARPIDCSAHARGLATIAFRGVDGGGRLGRLVHCLCDQACHLRADSGSDRDNFQLRRVTAFLSRTSNCARASGDRASYCWRGVNHYRLAQRFVLFGIEVAIGEEIWLGKISLADK